MKTIVNNDTGEVIEAPKFRSMWSNPFGIQGEDYSNEFEEVFEQVEPFAIDAQTGELLNKTSVPMLISKGKVNIKERIQSFADQVDLYKILERFAYSGDETIINARNCEYGDISQMPDNLNDFAQFVNKHFKNLDKLNPELAKMVVDPNVSSEDIEKKANDIYQMRLDDYIKQNENKEVKEENK